MADSVINYSDLIGEDDTFDVIFDNIDKLKKELNDLTKIAQKDISLVNPNDEKQLEKAVKQVDKLVAAKKILDKEEKQAIKTKKKLSQLTDEELIQREKLKIANRERVQIAKQNAILLSKESGQIEKLRAKLSLTTLEWKKLSKEELNNTKKGKDLINTKKRLTDQLKKLEKQTGDTRRNVGNYTSSLGKLGKAAAAVFVGRSFVDGLRRISGAVGQLIEDNKDANSTIKGLSDSLGGVTEAVSGAALKLLNFLAPAITAVADGISAVINFFSGAITPVEKFSATSDELVKTTEALKDEFVKEQVAANSLFNSLKDTNKSSEERKEIIKEINKQYGAYIPNLLTETSSLEAIAIAQRAVNDELNRNFRAKVQQATQTDILTNKINFQNKAFEDFKKVAEDLNISVGADLGFAFSQLLDDFRATGTEGNKAAKSLTDYVFKITKVADEIKKTNPQLGELLETIKAVKVQGSRTSFSALITQFNEAANTSTGYNNALNTTQNILASLTKDQPKATATVSDNTSTVKDNTSAIEKNNAARLKAIQSIQNQLKKSEVDNIEDAQEAAIRLEELRFEAEKDARAESIEKILLLQKEQAILIREQSGKDSQELKDFLEEKRAEIRELTALNDKLEIETLATHEQNKLDIRKDFEDKRIAGIKKTVEAAQKLIKQANKEEQDFLKEQGKINTDDAIKQNEETEKKLAEQRSDNLKKRKEREKEFFDGIIESSKKVGAAIVKTFDKQAELAGSLVKQQADAVETQRKRAEDGLENTLKFEQDQLAQRESERIKAEQKAKNAAKILTLFNLVSAYAQSGDSNALQRGLVDFALLTALESAFTGFETGGYTGENGKSDVSGVVHGQEYVVTAADTAKFGLKGKTGAEFGEAMTDYFNQSPVLTNTYNQQNEQFNSGLKPSNNVDFSRLEMEVRAMRQAFQNHQNNSFDIEEMTDYFVDIAKRVTQNRMTTVTKVRKRL